MGEALGVPGQAEGIDSDGIPNESVLLSQLIQTLSQRQEQTLLLSDLGALLPANLRLRVKDQGGLRLWLQRHPTLFNVSGQPGKEFVTLALDCNPETLDAEHNLGAELNFGAEELTMGAEESLADKESENALGALPNQDMATSKAVLNQEASPVQDLPATDTEVAAAETASPVAAAAAGGADAPFDEEVDGQLALQLRGLPYRATMEDVRNFLGEHIQHLAAESPIHFDMNRDGRPSGFARVQFTSPEAAVNCRDKLHLRGMEDRYVEVFLYSERPSRGRQRRGFPEDGAGCEVSTRRNDLMAEVQGITRENVVGELRSQMVEPLKRRLLLSMLGVALSPAARSYLKLNDQGLKHFLAQFPKEFTVEGGKGSEHVTYTPISLSEALDDVGSTGPPQSEDQGGNGTSGLEDLLPASPTQKPAVALSVEPTPSGTGNCGFRGLRTPSLWGSPYDTAWAEISALGQNFPQPANNTSTASNHIWPTTAPQHTNNNINTNLTNNSSTTTNNIWPGLAAALTMDNITSNPAPGGAAVATITNWGAAPSWPMPPGPAPMPPGAAPPAWPGWWSQFPHCMGGQPPDLAAMGFPGLPPPAVPGTFPAPGVQPYAGAADAGMLGPPPPLPPAPAAAAATATDDAGLGAAVRLRGLPFQSREQDVLSFFSQHDVVDCIADGPKAVTFMTRTNGRPSGQAVVQMRCRADAELTLKVLHNQSMGNRYIEVFLHNGDVSAGSNPPFQPAAASATATHGSEGAGIVTQPAGAAAAQRIPAPKAVAEMTQPSAMHSMLLTAMQGGMVPPYVPPVTAQWNSQMWGPPPIQPAAPAMGGSDAAWEALFQFIPESRAYMQSQALP